MRGPGADVGDPPEGRWNMILVTRQAKREIFGWKVGH